MNDDMHSADIFVKTHVARDLLQSAGLFRTDKLVVWEYVSNSLEYVDPGVAAVVRVVLDGKRRRITIDDNGRGMDWSGLQNFFIMHGENLDRKQNRPGRGRFGTGKSAAFGIANTLRITTVRDQRRSKVELRREDLERMPSDAPVPVRQLERETTVSQPNGTLVEIEQVNLRSLDQAGIIRFIERHLARWPKNVTVLVNNHECEFAEPLIAQDRHFFPTATEGTRLAKVELVIKVAKGALEEDLRGVSIYSKGVWYETTLAGSEGRDMAQYLFGEIDVPALDDDRSPISPFDVSRSMRLNPNNDLVQAVLAFVGSRIEQVRRELVEAERSRRATEEARRLAREAEEIARVINEDFAEFRQRVSQVRARTGGAVDFSDSATDGGSSIDDLAAGGDLPAIVQEHRGEPGHGDGSPLGGTEPPNLGPRLAAGAPESPRLGQDSGKRDSKPTTTGGFQVRFEKMGEASNRAKYVRDERTIYVNVDHPQLVAASRSGSFEDVMFRRLSYEIAFAEYAVALASELAARDEYVDPSDPIVDIRETLNRVARRGATLYSEDPRPNDEPGH